MNFFGLAFVSHYLLDSCCIQEFGATNGLFIDPFPKQADTIFGLNKVCQIFFFIFSTSGPFFRKTEKRKCSFVVTVANPWDAGIHVLHFVSEQLIQLVTKTSTCMILSFEEVFDSNVRFHFFFLILFFSWSS